MAASTAATLTQVVDLLIIGAGAAGLTAAHDLLNLEASPLNVKILEARDRIGGRVQKLADFGSDNVPIDLGGEWLATDKAFLDELANGGFVNANGRPRPSLSVETTPWDPPNYLYDDKKQTWKTQEGTKMIKFVNTTWFDYFDSFIATPKVKENIVIGCAVTNVDHSGTEAPIVAHCQDGRSWQAQQVIVTVPIPILQEDLMFTPGLPPEHQDAIDAQGFLAGQKVVLHFSEKFYHDVFLLSQWDSSKESGNFYYNPFHNAPHDLQQPKNVLIASFYGEFASQYIDYTSEQLLDQVLTDLDRVYGNGNTIATDSLLDHYVHNWNQQAFSQGIYSNGEGFQEADVLRQPTPDGTIIFAGEHIPPEGVYYGYVHGAAYSGRRAAGQVTAQPLAPADEDVPSTTGTEGGFVRPTPPSTPKCGSLLANGYGGAGNQAKGCDGQRKRQPFTKGIRGAKRPVDSSWP